MLDAKELAKQNSIRSKNVLRGFTNANEIEKSDLLEKGIELVTHEEFTKKYGQGHEIYTPKGLKKYMDDLKSNIEKGESDDLNDTISKANDEVKDLRKVAVDKDGQRTLVFVREKK